MADVLGVVAHLHLLSWRAQLLLPKRSAGILFTFVLLRIARRYLFFLGFARRWSQQTLVLAGAGERRVLQVVIVVVVLVVLAGIVEGAPKVGALADAVVAQGLGPAHHVAWIDGDQLVDNDLVFVVLVGVRGLACPHLLFVHRLPVRPGHGASLSGALIIIESAYVLLDVGEVLTRVLNQALRQQRAFLQKLLILLLSLLSHRRVILRNAILRIGLAGHSILLKQLVVEPRAMAFQIAS